LLLTLDPDTRMDATRLATRFDLTSVNITFTFKTLRAPVKTPVGKVPLLIPETLWHLVPK